MCLNFPSEITRRMRAVGALFFNLALLLLVKQASTQSDCNGCCHNETGYQEIDEPRRSINSVWEYGQQALCDRSLSWGWYRFTSYVGGEMPTSKVDRNRCGTLAPVWLNGDHPVNGTVTRKACVNFYDSNNGCAESFDIKVTNCGSYFVYYLRPTYSCAVAYCAGTGIPCPYGQVRHPNDGQCYDAPIQFDRDYLREPNISYVPLPHDDGTNPGFEIKDIHINVTLKCEVHFNRDVQSWKNVTYLVEWYSEGINLKKDYPCGTLPPDETEYDSACLEPGRPLLSYLNSTDYELNRLISCKVSAKYTTSPLNPWSIPKTVPKPFFAGIKIFPNLLKLKACDLEVTTTTIKIKPTIPVRRGYTGSYLNISFWLPNGLSLKYEDCAVGVEGTKEVSIDVIAQCADFGETTTKVIVAEIHDIHSIFWGGKRFHLPKILVYVESSAAKIDECLAYLDPHYLSFSTTLSNGNLGWRYGYAFMGHGDFIMYSNAERKFEVHTRQWTCGYSRTCNCGVVLRDHNDVIEFNCCNEYLYYDHVTPIRVRVRSKKRLAPGISIRQTLTGFNSEYRVEFPSGMQVKIFRNWYGLEVNVKGPRAEHVTNETGLCLYTGQQNIAEFGYNFRMEPQESYFERLPEWVDDTSVEFEEPCSCFKVDANRNPTCGPAIIVNYPNESDKPGVPVDAEGSEGTEGERRKRSTDYVDDLTDVEFDSFKRYVASVVSKRHRRSSEYNSSFTKQNATEYCMERLLNSEVGSLCSQIGADVHELVASCSVDVEATGDTSYATSAVSLMINECGGIVGRNLSSNINESSEEKQKVPSLLTNIIEKLCPNDCTFNGKCVNGSCICNKEFTAEDCAVSIYQRPDISMLQGNGLCDRRKRPCRKVTVMGTGFLNSTNMTCHIVEFMVTNSSWTPNKKEIRLPGVMTDLILAECQLPKSPVMPGHYHEGNEGTPAAGLLISMSNDGDHKSAKHLSFISYDSACLNCSISNGCFLKENSCFINRYCFAANEPNPIDLCYQCLPNVSSNSWTKRLVNFPPVFSSTTQYYALFQETLELAIDISDPEGLPVTVSLEGNSKEAVMHQNVLRWNVSSDSSTHFSLKATDACQASATLNITVNLVACQCKNGSCVPHPNKPRGSGLYECNCLPGFSGSKCETNIDDCQSSPCLRGRCIDEVNKFRCICDPGYVGTRCETDFDDCSSSPCVHGNCTDYTGAYRCSCDSGYGGENCNVNIDDCQSSPCIHGACVDGVNNYTCQCQSGYTGYHCDIQIDECQSSPCIQGRCVDRINNFTCICDVGFTGEKCNFNIDDCLQAICGNGTCVDSFNNYSCQCNAGFTGRNCDLRITHCGADSCYPNVPCFESNQAIYCGSCPLGLTGDGRNCRDIDYCTNASCNNGGSCVDGLSNYSCSCVAGFTGIHCETDIDYCTNITCNNGGSCVDGLSNYSCFCVAGYTGIHCETDIDDCVNHTCLNGGSCVDNINNYSCVCGKGFTGNYCQIALPSSASTTTGSSVPDGRPNLSSKTPLMVSSRYAVTYSMKDLLPSISTSYSSPQQRETRPVQPTATRNLPARLSSSSVANVYPTPTPPSTETEKLTAHAFKIRISNEDWNEDLRDIKSSAFQNLSARMEGELMKALSAQKDLVGVKVLSFSKGSVVAEFQLMFRTSVSFNDAFVALESKVSDGNLGSLRVDPKSLEQINRSTQEPSNDDDENKLGFPIIIGISCGGAFLLLLVIIVLINRYKKIKMYIVRQKKHPNSGADYELKKPRSKEHTLDKDVEGKVNNAYNY